MATAKIRCMHDNRLCNWSGCGALAVNEVCFLPLQFESRRSASGQIVPIGGRTVPWLI